MDAKTKATDAEPKAASLTVGNSKHDFPVYPGTIGPSVIDIGKLYGQTGMFTYDPGFTSTGRKTWSLARPVLEDAWYWNTSA